MNNFEELTALDCGAMLLKSLLYLALAAVVDDSSKSPATILHPLECYDAYKKYESLAQI